MALIVVLLGSPFGSNAASIGATDLSSQIIDSEFLAKAIDSGDIKKDEIVIQIDSDASEEVVLQEIKDTLINAEIRVGRRGDEQFKTFAIASLHGKPINQESLDKVNNIDGVANAGPNVIYRASAINDPSFGDQWALENTGQLGGLFDADIDAPAAWATYGIGSSPVIVAVVDSGVQLEHVEFSSNWPSSSERIWKNPGETDMSGLCINNGIDDDGNLLVDDCFGYDFVDFEPSNPPPVEAGTNPPEDNDPSPCGQNIHILDASDVGDCSGLDSLVAHGTHVAGIIAATQDNSIGISGVAPGVTIMPVRALTEDGIGTTFDVLEAMTYAISEGASIINMSFGSNVYDSSFDAIVATAIANDVILVAAAGNGASHYNPANNPENIRTGSDCDSPVCNDDPYGNGGNAVLTVAATERHDRKANFSKYSTENFVDVAAPGDSILSTCYDRGLTFSCNSSEPSEYVQMSGTSQAAPHVSGVAALLRSQYPSLTASQISNIIRSGGDDIDNQNIGLGACGGTDCTTGPNGTLGGSRLNSFVALNSPSLISVSPATGSRGTQVTGVSVAGINTTFGAGTTISFGSGIDVSNISCSSATLCTVNLNVTNSAPLGPHTVTVTTGTEVVSGFNFFTVTDAILRIAGANRRLTAVEVSKNGFPAAGSADAVVIARDDTFPDSLAGAPLAALAKGPLLFTQTNSLDGAVSAEILRVLDPSFDAEPDIYILGLNAAISANVEASLNAFNNNWQVKRLGGSSRDYTAIKIADEETLLRGGPPDQVFIATNAAFPDALSAAVPAGDPNINAKRIPILLTRTSSLSTPTADYLLDNAANISTAFIVGGTAAVSLATQGAIDAIIPSVLRLSGGDRYTTAKAISDNFYPSPISVSFASGLNFPDALSGGWHSSLYHSPLVLIKGSEIPQATRDFITSHAGSILGGFMYGGTSVIPESVRAVLEGII